MVTINYSERVNYSLFYAGLQPVILSAALPGPAQVEVSIAGYSNALHLSSGVTENVSPPLDAAMFARLSAPARSQLLVRRGGDVIQCHPLTVSPLCAWDQRRASAKSTAAFVLENDNLIADLLREAAATPCPAAGACETSRRAALLFEMVKRVFVPCYYYDRNLFPETEQAVRFPRQMKYDGGGTCIDFALVYAAALYKAGLRPVVALLGHEVGTRHAVTCYWATQHSAGTTLNAWELRESLNAGALVPVEVTCAASGRPFDVAVEEGRRVTNSSTLLWGVDVEEARGEGILSLPGKPCETVIGGWEVRPVGDATATRTAAAADILKGLTVQVLESPDAVDRQRSYELNSYRARIGRNPHRDEICLRALTVSNPHAVLFVVDSDIYLEDLWSKGGTFVGGRRVPPHQPVLVRPGETFQVADVRLRLKAQAAEEEASHVRTNR
jgi:hypothetical protein